MPSRPLLALPGRCSVDDVAVLAAAILPLVRAGMADGAERDAQASAAAESPVVFVHDPSLDAAEVEAMCQRIADGLPDLPETDVVVTTSGSSGRPRLVGISARALTLSSRATLAHLGQSTTASASPPLQWVLTLPTFHVAGLLVIWRALLQGTQPHVVDSSQGFAPSMLSSCLDALPTQTAVVSLVPTQLQRMLQSDANRRSLSRAKVVLVGGAALAPSLAAAAAAAKVKVATTYGMTETCGGCVYSGSPLDGVQVFVEPLAPQNLDELSGPPTPGLQQTDDPGDTNLSPHPSSLEAEITGRIFLRTPALAEGYLGEPELTAQAFPTLGQGTGATGRGERWHRTGDVGSWDGRLLRVAGRADDLINTGGEKVAPAAVEDALLATGLVGTACVVGVADSLWGQAVVALVTPLPAQTAEGQALAQAQATAEEQGLAEAHALAEGQAPAAKGQTPAEGQAPDEGQAPAEAQAPAAKGQTPAEGQAPDEGQAPAEAQAPAAKGQTPAEAHTTAEGQAPAQAQTSTTQRATPVEALSPSPSTLPPPVGAAVASGRSSAALPPAAPSAALTRALQTAAKAWPPPWRPKQIVVRSALPLLPNGKVDKRACLSLALAAASQGAPR